MDIQITINEFKGLFNPLKGTDVELRDEEIEIESFQDQGDLYLKIKTRNIVYRYKNGKRHGSQDYFEKSGKKFRPSWIFQDGELIEMS